MSFDPSWIHFRQPKEQKVTLSGGLRVIQGNGKTSSAAAALLLWTLIAPTQRTANP
jgi:hypothetical protein